MSFYRQTVPPLIKGLNNLSGLLTKGVKFANEKGMPHEEMLNFRLVADMRPLTYQVQSCCNVAKFLLPRFGLGEDTFFEDDEATFDQMQGRITKTIDLLKTMDKAKLDAKQDEPVTMNVKGGPFHFTDGQSYVLDYVLPYFHFHLGTAYCLLRRQGVDIGALDYLGHDTFVRA